MPTVDDHDPIKVTKLHDAILRQTQRWRQQHSSSINTNNADDDATAAKQQTHQRNLHPSQRIQTRPSASTLTARIDPLQGHVIEPPRIIPPLRVRRTDVLVVGGGPAGLSAALSAKRVASSPSVDTHRRALDVTLVESAGYFGGTITKTGMETMGWYRYPGTRECHAGLGREMEKRAERMGFASKWPFNESVCLHPHHFKYVADCLVREAGVRPLLHSRVVEVIMDDGEDCERGEGEDEETDGDNENDGRFRTIRGVILETPSGREAILAKRIVDTTGDAIVAYLAGAPFRKTHKSEMMGVTTVFGMEGVDKARFEEHVRQNQATYKDWNTESWEALTTGKEDGIASPYWGKIFEEAAKEGIIDANGYGAITDNMDQASIDGKQETNTKTNPNLSNASEQQSPTPQTSQSQTTPNAEVDICGSWSAISPSGVATNLNLIHMKHIDPTDSDDVTRAEMTGRHHVYSAMNALRAKVPGFENATLNSVSAHLGVRDSRYLDSHGNHRLSGWHVTNEGTCHDSIGVFPEFVDGYNILILPTTGRVFEVPLSMMIPKRVDNLILAGRHVDVDPIACAAMRNMMACAVTGQGAGVAAAVSVWEDTTVREVDVRKVQKELRKQGVSLSKAELLEKEERSSDDGDKNEIVGCGNGAKRDGTPRLTSKL